MRLRSIFLVLLLGAACAMSKPAPEVSVKVDPFDERAGDLMRALQSKNAARAEAFFDARMRAALPASKLTTVLEGLSDRFGAIRSWAIVHRSAAMPERPHRETNLQLRDLDVAFEKGHLTAHVVMNESTRAVSGLFFRPPRPEFKSDPVDPLAGYRAEEVKVGAAPFLLGGTLTIPKGGGRFPAVVLVAGSGPEDRDETIGANKPLLDLAEGLASKGIVVLRYDKRTYAYPENMDFQHTTVEEEVIADAVAAVTLLRSRPEVDPKRIFVLGHSLGATLAPEIARRAAPVAGVLMLAPAFRLTPMTVVEQLRYLGAPEAQIAPIEAAAKRLMAGQMSPDHAFFGAPVRYWTDLMHRDEVAIARSLGTPILILRGDRDYQVTGEDVKSWQDGLRGVPRVEIESLPGLNHLFIEGTGRPGPAEYKVPGHVASVVIDRIAAFIRAS